MALRVFRFNGLVAISDDPDDRVPEPDIDETGQLLPTISSEDLAAQLCEAATVDWNAGEHGNPCGIVSMELNWDTLEELPRKEVVELYGKNA